MVGLACFAMGHASVLHAQHPPLEALAADLVAAGSPAAGVLMLEAGVVRFAVAGERILGGGDAVERGDRWHLGSNGKAMTAVLAGRLVEQEILGWETPLGDLEGRGLDGIPEWAAHATLLQLLSHTSGMPANLPPADAMAMLGPDRERDARADRLHFARRILEGEAGGAPGAFLYSNVGYVMAAILMEAVSHRSWEELMDAEVFVPLGLSSAGMGPPGVHGSRDSPTEPWGHLGGAAGALLPIPPSGLADNPPAMGPAGRIHMTLEDYGTFLAAVLAGLR
ncbi:MAG: class A beta-lactamase-related serine hydrolase, partial [Gemmatimonadales bacterium]